MLDRDGLVCEYDGYVITEQGEDTPENRVLREKAMEKALERARRIMEERGGDEARTER